MKKIVLALIAALCLCSCVRDEQEVIYIISVGISEYSVSGPTNSDARNVLNEFDSMVSLFSKQEAFTWTETVVNSDYSTADAQAHARFESYLPQFKQIETTNKAKLESCTDDMTEFSVSYSMKLDRVGNESAVLAKETISISYGE